MSYFGGSVVVGPVLPVAVLVVVVDPGAGVTADPAPVEVTSVLLLVWLFYSGLRAGTGWEVTFLLIQLVPFHVLPSGHEMHSPLCNQDPLAQLTLTSTLVSDVL